MITFVGLGLFDEKDVTVKGTILEISEIRTFARMGSPGKVAVAVLKDESGKIDLTLWDEDTEEFKAGDFVVVENGKVKQFRGNLQLTTGNNGSVEKV